MDSFDMWVLVQYIEDFQKYMNKKYDEMENHFDDIVLEQVKQMVIKEAEYSSH